MKATPGKPLFFLCTGSILNTWSIFYCRFILFQGQFNNKKSLVISTNSHCGEINMGHVTKVGLSCNLVLLSCDSKTRLKRQAHLCDPTHMMLFFFLTKMGKSILWKTKIILKIQPLVTSSHFIHPSCYLQNSLRRLSELTRLSGWLVPTHWAFTSSTLAPTSFEGLVSLESCEKKRVFWNHNILACISHYVLIYQWVCARHDKVF